MNLYLISGLGADRSTFTRLELDHRIRVHYLDWIEPRLNESMNAYARRLAEKIDTHKGPYSIAGLSFGGMLASEMNTFLHPEKVVLLSSVNSYGELPFYYRWAGKAGIHRLLPSKPGRRSNVFLNWLFGIKGKADQALLNEVIAHTDPVFSRWAIDALLHWQRCETDERVIRIHGDHDRVLPRTTFTTHYTIKGGGHLVVLNRAAEVSRILNQVLLEGRSPTSPDS